MTDAEIAELWATAKAEYGDAVGGPMEHQIFARLVEAAAVDRERAACIRACLDLAAPDLSQASGEYHRFYITTMACATAIRKRAKD